ncbi:hypothetical protein EYF80_013224 [Liparis tanakae]|uniref:Uncharacterized protein n=1 Tax=Liparis tanakae TaxID=230148 RepID=A0A4Z2IGL5_9TELE|nr:hypothetical protein EYF80_013224 [Liparis tanakae]
MKRSVEEGRLCLGVVGSGRRDGAEKERPGPWPSIGHCTGFILAHSSGDNNALARCSDWKGRAKIGIENLARLKLKIEMRKQ